MPRVLIVDDDEDLLAVLQEALQVRGCMVTPCRAVAEARGFADAPLIVGVVSTADPNHPKIPLWEQQLSAGAVCFNLLHAAAAHGFKTPGAQVVAAPFHHTGGKINVQGFLQRGNVFMQ